MVKQHLSWKNCLYCNVKIAQKTCTLAARFTVTQKLSLFDEIFTLDFYGLLQQSLLTKAIMGLILKTSQFIEHEQHFAATALQLTLKQIIFL